MRMGQTNGASMLHIWKGALESNAVNGMSDHFFIVVGDMTLRLADTSIILARKLQNVLGQKKKILQSWAGTLGLGIDGLKCELKCEHVFCLLSFQNWSILKF